jgi:hypothetical protein
MRSIKVIGRNAAALFALGITPVACQSPPESGDSQNISADLAVEPEASDCKIGDTTIEGLPDGSQACKDAKAMASTLAKAGNPVHIEQETCNTDSDGFLASSFVTPGLDTRYSVYLAAGGGFNLQLVDDFAGVAIYSHDAAEGNWVDEEYFSQLTLKQTSDLVTAMGEAVATRMRGSAGRLLGGGTPDGDGSEKRECVAECAAMVCSLPHRFAQAVSLLRIPAIGHSGSNAEGKILAKACLDRGPTILAKGAYCCKSIEKTGMSGSKTIVRGMDCRAIDGDSKDANACNLGGNRKIDCVEEEFGNSTVTGCILS